MLVTRGRPLAVVALNAVVRAHGEKRARVSLKSMMSFHQELSRNEKGQSSVDVVLWGSVMLSAQAFSSDQEDERRPGIILFGVDCWRMGFRGLELVV